MASVWRGWGLHSERRLRGLFTMQDPTPAPGYARLAAFSAEGSSPTSSRSRAGSELHATLCFAAILAGAQRLVNCLLSSRFPSDFPRLGWRITRARSPGKSRRDGAIVTEVTRAPRAPAHIAFLHFLAPRGPEFRCGPTAGATLVVKPWNGAGREVPSAPRARGPAPALSARGVLHHHRDSPLSLEHCQGSPDAFRTRTSMGTRPIKAHTQFRIDPFCGRHPERFTLRVTGAGMWNAKRHRAARRDITYRITQPAITTGPAHRPSVTADVRTVPARRGRQGASASMTPAVLAPRASRASLQAPPLLPPTPPHTPPAPPRAARSCRQRSGSTPAVVTTTPRSTRIPLPVADGSSPRCSARLQEVLVRACAADRGLVLTNPSPRSAACGLLPGDTYV